jgi:hypothetical protein
MKRLMMAGAATLALTLAGVFWVRGGEAKPAPAKSRAVPQMTFKPRDLADSVRAVVAANRLVYARLVQRLSAEEKVLPCVPDWQQRKGLPLPSEMLRLESHAVQREGAEFSYVLRALQPLDPRNRPETPVEKAGLEFVLKHPETSFYTNETLGGRRYFTAVYADRATVPACADCHNAHPATPRKDLRTGEVLGGLVVRVALEF